MKIRNRRLVAAAGWLGTRVARGLFATLRFEYRPLGPSCAPPDIPSGDRIIYSIWHENLLLPTISFGCPEIAVLISKHADGQVLGALITSLGMGMVCGSTNTGRNRGGVEAVRKLVAPDNPWRHLAVTPDGPRGPRREAQPGVIYIASRTGMKIVSVGVGYRRPWRAGSWDQFALPKPFSRAVCVTDEPIFVPPGLKAVELEPYRLRVQADMDRLNGLAEARAESSRRIAVGPSLGRTGS